MVKIESVRGREVLDSRGNPTVEVDVFLETGHIGRMMVPSGASTGKHEALELRDGDTNRYCGKGVLKAVENVNVILAQALKGKNVDNQEEIDELMINLDGTPNKSRIGANAVLGASIAVAKAAAVYRGIPFYRYLADRYLINGVLSVPIPMVNILSGGLHAGKNIDIQDFLVIPIGADSYPKALEMISKVYWTMKEILINKGYVTLLADEGGFGPQLPSNKEALELLCLAMKQSGIEPGKEMKIALDVASTHFYNPESLTYHLKSENRVLTSSEMIDMLEEWVSEYPILSLEDGLSEDDWDGWSRLTERLGSKVQLIGDDLFTTNSLRIQQGIDSKAGNAVLIKMNQIGTLTETVSAIRKTKEAGWNTIISARSGETEDHTLSDLAVGLQGGQIKVGSIARSSRLSKYNQLLRINEDLNGAYTGNTIFKKFHALK
jgi:enolase